ncbi:unnamed protein product [Effrenium voratum]|uniref:Uncharacterized protein n=1 Tax=Effrenium voratum TaxID=2562239 RepID=A0AA36J6R8_9DINO|nr:unnamed protein product [Effrenium voratum]
MTSVVKLLDMDISGRLGRARLKRPSEREGHSGLSSGEVGAAKKTPKQKGPAGETSVAPAAALSWSTAREAARCHQRARSRCDPAVGQRRAGFDALAPRSLGDAVVAFPACSSHFFHLGCAAQLRVQAAAAADLLCPLCHGDGQIVDAVLRELCAQQSVHSSQGVALQAAGLPCCGGDRESDCRFSGRRSPKPPTRAYVPFLLAAAGLLQEDAQRAWSDHPAAATAWLACRQHPPLDPHSLSNVIVGAAAGWPFLLAHAARASAAAQEALLVEILGLRGAGQFDRLAELRARASELEEKAKRQEEISALQSHILEVEMQRCQEELQLSRSKVEALEKELKQAQKLKQRCEAKLPASSQEAVHRHEMAVRASFEDTRAETRERTSPSRKASKAEAQQGWFACCSVQHAPKGRA